MYNSEIKAFIKGKSSLFWSIPEDKKEKVSPALLVETILNYGTMDDVRKLIKLMSLEEVSRVFFSAKGRQKLNYYPEIYNYFSLLFKKYSKVNSPEKEHDLHQLSNGMKLNQLIKHSLYHYRLMAAADPS